MPFPMVLSDDMSVMLFSVVLSDDMSVMLFSVVLSDDIPLMPSVLGHLAILGGAVPIVAANEDNRSHKTEQGQNSCHPSQRLSECLIALHVTPLVLDYIAET